MAAVSSKLSRPSGGYGKLAVMILLRSTAPSKPARCALAACLSLLLLPLSPANAGAKHSPLTHLASSLVDAPAPLRVDLAQAALIELSATYTQEAQRARDDLRRNPRNRDLRRWADAIDRLATEQSTLAASLTLATPVDVSIGPDHDLHLNIAGKPVVIAGPRPREQAALERRILERYCNLNLCDPIALAALPSRNGTLAIRGPHSSSAIAELDGTNTRWSFSPAGPSCATEDGLEFQFSNADSLRQKRKLCAQIAAELQQLSAAIARQMTLGITVDWNALRIQPVTELGIHRVVLNASGTNIELQIPNLNALPELFDMVRPWLVAKVRGEIYHLVVVNADRLMGPLLLMP